MQTSRALFLTLNLMLNDQECLAIIRLRVVAHHGGCLAFDSRRRLAVLDPIKLLEHYAVLTLDLGKPNFVAVTMRS